MPDIPIRLTQFSHGGGCGCKIAPKVLEQILSGSIQFPGNGNLLVGNNSNDDAAVYNIGNGSAIISTTDFFMPIVDDPFDFGRIAAGNAISDVYAMGGTPLLAIAILGWPVEKLPLLAAQKVIEGAGSICEEASIPLAGGHSIDSTEPIFGLAVTGIVKVEHLKKNNTALVGDYIFLTKPIGVGILSTAEKKEKLLEEHKGIAASQMSQLNKIGEALGKISSVTAMTDVTGFGLAGHLIEVAEGSGVSAEIYWSKILFSTDLNYYLGNRIFPGATFRNWDSYGNKIEFGKSIPVNEASILLPDPQTNGGLLFTVKEKGLDEVKEVLNKYSLTKFNEPIGRIVEKREKVVMVK